MKKYISLFLTASIISVNFLMSEQKDACSKADDKICVCDADNTCALKTSDTQVKHSYASIDTAALKILIDSGSPLVLLDARTGQWDDGKRISNAKSLSYEATAEEAEAVIPSKSALIVVYCGSSQCPASKYLAEKLVSFGYPYVLKYTAGIKGWREAGFSVQ